MSAWDATHAYFVTNGHFPLQVEDLVAQHAVQLIDGDELAALVDGRSTAPTSVQPATKVLDDDIQGKAAFTDPGWGSAEAVAPASDAETVVLETPYADLNKEGEATEPMASSGRTVVLDGKPGHVNGVVTHGATVRISTAPATNGNGDSHLEGADIEGLDVVTGPVAENGARLESSDV
jgi:hypothetical protein